MLNHPVAPLRSGYFAVCLAGALVLAGLATDVREARAAGPSASEIIHKMQQVYRAANTFHATLEGTRTGKMPDGKAFSVHQIQEIAFRRPNLFYQRLTFSGTGAAAQASKGSQVTVCDGKHVFQYVPALNQCVKLPAPQQTPKLSLSEIPYDLSTAKIQGAAQVGGRSAYMVRVRLRGQPGHPPPSVDLYIDRSNYQLLRFVPTGAASGENVMNQTVNGTVPASLFSFVPPRGVKVVTPAPGAAPPRR